MNFVNTTSSLNVYCTRRESGLSEQDAYNVAIKFSEHQFFTVMTELLGSSEQDEVEKGTDANKLEKISEVFEDFKFAKYSPVEVFEYAYSQRNKVLDL